jgi:hypothetical protein
MPAKHHIDNNAKLIITTWEGEAVDIELIETIKKYQNTIQLQPEYVDYNEVVDFSKVTNVKLTTEGIREISKIAVKTDHVDIKTKLAIIVSSPLVYGLARMYEIYRNLAPNPNKEIKVFNEMSDAYSWIEMKT